MQAINKKALSDVLAVSFLILLGVVVGFLIYTSINKISEPMMSPQKCLEYQQTPPIKIAKACYNKETGDLELTLNKLTEEKVESAYFMVNEESGETSSWCCNEEECPDCKIIQNINDIKTYFLQLDQKPIKASLSLDACSLPQEAISDC